MRKALQRDAATLQLESGGDVEATGGNRDVTNLLFRQSLQKFDSPGDWREVARGIGLFLLQQSMELGFDLVLLLLRRGVAGEQLANDRRAGRFVVRSPIERGQ